MLMRKLILIVCAVLLIGGLFLIGCPAPEAPEQEVQESATKDVTIAVITHGGVGDSFWDVVKRGAEAAGDDLNITVNYQGDGDAPTQARLIDTAVSGGVDGIVVSLANPQALEQSIRSAVSNGIPVITINSGVDFYKDFGAITHVGQTEYIAGVGAGERLAGLGVTNLLCVIHEQGNSGLEERCAGAIEGLANSVENFYVTGTADVAATVSEIQAKLQASSAIDGVLTLNPVVALAAKDAISGSGSGATLGTFDLNGDVVSAIQDGDIAFAIDQQQYLQGYLPVVFLYLNKVNANTVGGGLPVLTGPGFVDSSNAAAVVNLAAAGTR